MGFRSLYTIKFTKSPSFLLHLHFSHIFDDILTFILISLVLSFILSLFFDIGGFLLLFFLVLNFSCIQVRVYLVISIIYLFFFVFLLRNVLVFLIFLFLNFEVFLVWGLFLIFVVNDMILFFLKEFCILCHFELYFPTFSLFLRVSCIYLECWWILGRE